MKNFILGFITALTLSLATTNYLQYQGQMALSAQGITYASASQQPYASNDEFTAFLDQQAER